MMIYQVYGFDPMASSMGAYYIESSYSSRELADIRAEQLNRMYREHFLANCSPAGRENVKYIEKAHVKEVDVK